MENQINGQTRPQLNSLQHFNYAETPVLAGIMTTGEVVALRPVVENLGLDWSSQLKRLKRDPKLNQLWSHSKVISTDGKSYDMVCLQAADFQNWLWDLNASENLNLSLWEEYKKGLVLYLIQMLQVSLDEVQRLRGIETEYSFLKSEVLEYITANEAGKDFSKSAKEKFKEANQLQRKILDRMENTNLNQLVLL